MITGVMEENTAAEVGFVVYPNPLINDSLTIKINEKVSIKGDIKISINDLNGKEIYHHQFVKNTLQMSVSTEKLEKGVYIITLHVADKSMATRLVVLD
jgi:hypothetical protein